MSKPMSMLAATVTIGGVLAVASSAMAATPHTSPQVQQVSFASSSASATSSTHHTLHVQLTASQNSSFSSGDSVDVLLSDGTSPQSELHDWTFPVAASALTVDPTTGSGTLNVPAANIAPYGDISLSLSAIGPPTTVSCHGAPSSQTQTVSVTGTLFFDTKSTGSHKWGTVGSQTSPFTFAATNQVTWTYANALPCNSLTIPCASGLFWQAQHGQVALQGTQSGKSSVLFASRTTDLGTPQGATRDDEAYATAKPQEVAVSGTGASLPVTATGEGAGSAVLIGAGKGQSDSIFCRQSGKKRTETTKSWQGAKYSNGKNPLEIHEQVFGLIKVGNNKQSFLSKTTLS